VSESVDRRVLGAFRCVDAITGNSVMDPLPVSGSQLTLRPNRSGIYVIFNAPGLASLTTQFDPPGAWPAPSSFEVSIQDPTRRYLPRRAQVRAPQEPVSGTEPAPVLSPQTVTLYPAAAAAVGANWAVVHVSVVLAGTNPPHGLPWPVVRVLLAADNSVLATGAGDARGEALLAVPGIGVQVNAGGGGAVLQSNIAVVVQAWFDPSALTQPAGWVPNPDDLLSNLAAVGLKTATQSATLGAGQRIAISLSISVS